MRDLHWAERSLTAFLGPLSLSCLGAQLPLEEKMQDGGECQPRILHPNL